MHTNIQRNHEMDQNWYARRNMVGQVKNIFNYTGLPQVTKNIAESFFSGGGLLFDSH